MCTCCRTAPVAPQSVSAARAWRPHSALWVTLGHPAPATGIMMGTICLAAAPSEHGQPTKHETRVVWRMSCPHAELHPRATAPSSLHQRPAGELPISTLSSHTQGYYVTEIQWGFVFIGLLVLAGAMCASKPAPRTYCRARPESVTNAGAFLFAATTSG